MSVPLNESVSILFFGVSSMSMLPFHESFEPVSATAISAPSPVLYVRLGVLLMFFEVFTVTSSMPDFTGEVRPSEIAALGGMCTLMVIWMGLATLPDLSLQDA